MEKKQFSPVSDSLVTLPGRLGNPNFELRTDPRSDPRTPL